jgi:hypothetical protein
MLRAAYPLVKSANRTVDRLSTIGSEFSGQEVETETQDHIVDWRERVNLAGVPATIPDPDHRDSISWPQDTTRPRAVENSSLENMEVRSNLIQQGIDSYVRSDYAQANSCFKDAYDEGQVNTTPSQDAGVSDDTLKAWLWLSEIRVNSLQRKWSNVHVKSGLGSPSVNPATIKIETRIQICPDACILSLAFMYNGEVEKAHDLCNAARVGIERLKGTACEEYAEAVLALVEILYCKGRVPIAKVWRDRLLKDHGEILRERATKFFLQEFKNPPAPVSYQPGISNTVRGLRQPLTPQPAPESEANSRLRNAIERGNFLAAIFIISTFEPSVLKITSQDFVGKGLLVAGVRSHSGSIVFLLLQLYLELEKISGLPRPKNEYIKEAFKEAMSCDFAAAVELLIDAGANKNQTEHPPLDGLKTAHEESCYPLDWSSTKTPILANAVSEGHLATVKALLDKGAELNGPVTQFEVYKDIHIEPALHVVIRRFDGRQVIPLLLERGANVDCSFRDVRPLAMAIYHSGKPPENRGSSTNERIVSRKEVVEQLINNGADVNRRSLIEGERITPLQQARKKGLVSVERLLLAHGAVERRTTSRRKLRRKSGRKSRRTRVDSMFDSSSEGSLVDD